MVSVNLCRNNQSKYQVEQQYQTRTSEPTASSHGKIYLKTLIAIKKRLLIKNKFCEQIHVFLKLLAVFSFLNVPYSLLPFLTQRMF